MEQKDIKAVYFVGAGGIGMSAIARHFLSRGLVVAGYDRAPSSLTLQLEKEGMLIHYEEDVEAVPYACKDPSSCLVVYTPAVPETHKELRWFRDGGFCVEKRAQVLGRLTRDYDGLCVAGTHGKTTTSAMCAHIMHQSHVDCNAFLGGILKNYDTNYIFSRESPYVVIEADEYDRSFHWLRPWASVITSTDADHLDIYGTKEAYLESFRRYTALVRPGGTLIIHTGVELEPAAPGDVKVYSYGRDEGDFRAENAVIGEKGITFDFVSPLGGVPGVRLSLPVEVNIENCVAAMALAQLCGCTAEELRYGAATFAGVARRFDVKLKTPRHVLVSDYAHHPKEIVRSAESLRRMFPGRRLTAVFQPHLYSRTRDFYKEFASALSLFDEVFLCEIYPAREQPIEGVTSRLIYDNLAPGVAKEMTEPDKVGDIVRNRETDVLVVLGAGDLDSRVPALVRILKEKE